MNISMTTFLINLAIWAAIFLTVEHFDGGINKDSIIASLMLSLVFTSGGVMLDALISVFI